MQKEFIKNRKNQKIAVIVEQTESQKGLAFVMHGLSGSKEGPHIETMADAFKENDYTVVRFDTTNTFGESDGDYEDATTTNYYEDLEDVIKWASRQPWYREPFVLAGHSLGGICVALFAEKYPGKVKGLAPISTVVSGKLSLEAPSNKERWKEWKRTGWREEESQSMPGVIKRLKWSHMEDRLKYDLLTKIDKLTMPVLLIVGENDESTPSEHQQILYEALPGKKELHIIENAQHTFRDLGHLAEIKQIFNKWIGSI
jgi:pimeloyl-ACP methyl ester carboxylesterase